MHSERADARGNRLEKRFGHPALTAELFTPMLHAKMMPLLREVYKGRIEGKEQKPLDEYGGQKMEAQVVEGIRIAAINQRDLEYDPAQYQRDRGELDWDTQSIASSNFLGGMNDPVQRGKTPFYANATNNLPGYDKYMAGSTGPAENYELAHIDSPREPLLQPGTLEYYRQQQGFGSQQSLDSPVVGPAVPPGMYRDPGLSGMTREAPVHRPQQLSEAALGYGYGGVPMERGNGSAPGPFASPYSDRSPSPSQVYNPYSERARSPFIEQRPHSPQQRSATPQGQGLYQRTPYQQPVTPVVPYQQPQYQQSQQSPQPHRQFTSHEAHPSQYSQYSQHSQQPSNGNMAGRGAHKG